MKNYPIRPTDFKKYIGTPFRSYILPIVPVGGKLSPNSNISPEMLGKIPGRYNAQEGHWAGFAWQRNETTATQLQRWELQQLDTGPIAAGMRLDEVIAIDCDADTAEYVALQRRLAEKHLGITPVARRRDGAVRIQLFYKWKPHTPFIQKRRALFNDKEGVKYLTEVLGRGQQTVIEGPHASGKMYYWENGGLIEHADEMPEVTVDQTDAFLRAVAEASEAMGFEKARLSLPTARDHAAAVKISDLNSPHIAKDMKLLARAIKAIDINDPRLDDYDTWCLLFRATWAACGGYRAFYAEHILPWLLENPENKEEDLEATPVSFHDSMHGVKYVYEWAAEFGFTEGIYATVREIMANAPFQSPTESGGNQKIDGGDVSGESFDGGSAPTGPVPPNDTHRAIAKLFESTFAETRKFSVDAKNWMQFDSTTWEICHTILEDVGNLANEVATSILNNPTAAQANQRFRTLQSTGTQISIRTQLQGRKAMLVREADFDAHPHLLNTPGFIVDLRSGETLEHHPKYLMRQITLVTPDVLAYQNYGNACPRFMAFLEIIADGRDWVIPFLQRWFGYCLTGEIGRQHFLFLQGLPDTGKSQLITVLLKLMHTYATLLRESWMVKGGEKRFDMAAIVGKRLGLSDETQKGSTLDETRLSNVAGAPLLRAELKGGREFDFPNRVKLVLCGNHRPNFVSGEAGGLTRRMLLLEVTNKPLVQMLKVEENFADLLVEAEGPAILMWAIEGAMLDYADIDNMIFILLKREMVEATYRYTRENSLYWGWVESRCRPRERYGPV